jgi:hypothetical protein
VNIMNDPLDLLRPTPAALDESLRRRVFARTVQELRRQRRRQRIQAVAALAALAAAVLLLVTWLPAPQNGQRGRIRPIEPPAAAPESAVALEWQALDRPAEATRLYKQAGDRYLEEDDLESALRSYGGALDAGAADLDVDSDDSWLLMAIKLARKKESEQ